MNAALSLPCPAQHRPLNLRPWLALIVVAVTVSTLYSHGVTKHGSEAMAVRNCLDKNGPIQTWRNDYRDNWVYVCQLAPDKFGVQVVRKVNGKVQEVTAFLKAKMHTLTEVERYLENSGSYKIWSK